MKKYFKIIHKPKYVITISLVLAIIIGFIGYSIINQAPQYQYTKAGPGTIQNVWSLGNNPDVSGQNLTLSFQTSGIVNNIFVKVGDSVKKGQTLATLDPQNTLGALTQAKANYASAVANYNKLINGATSPDIGVSQASLNTAKTTLEHSKETLVQTLNNSLTVASDAVYNKTDILFNNPKSNTPELITIGVNFYNQTLEYQIQNERTSINSVLSLWEQELSDISTNSDLSTLTNQAQNNLQLIESYLNDLNSLFTSYASISPSSGIYTYVSQGNILSARVSITNQISLLTNASQAVSSATANITQSEASLNLKVSPARAEDIAIAEAQVTNASGAVQIAESAYQNRVVTAPDDGTVTAIYITVGQNATQNSPAIDLAGKTTSKNVSIMIPNNAIINRNGNSYVLVKTENGVEEKKIIIGLSDATNTEIISGISVGDEVANH